MRRRVRQARSRATSIPRRACLPAAALSLRCFAADADRMLLPALGSFAGGLNVLDRAILRLFPAGFNAYLLGDERVHRFPHHVLSAEPDALSHRIAT